ncbi:hypothetical protein VPHD249_0063 [Vibrio phage D249]
MECTARSNEDRKVLTHVYLDRHSVRLLHKQRHCIMVSGSIC